MDVSGAQEGKKGRGLTAPANVRRSFDEFFLFKKKISLKQLQKKGLWRRHGHVLVFVFVPSESEPTDRHEEQKDVKVWKNKHSPEEPVHKRQTMAHTPAAPCCRSRRHGHLSDGK